MIFFGGPKLSGRASDLGGRTLLGQRRGSAKGTSTKAGRQIRRSIGLVQPRDHTGDYDRTIMMLEMSVDDTIILDATEFDQYVRDVWAWSYNDATTLREYAVGTPVYRKPKRNWDDDEGES